MFCHKCGANISDDARFCGKCGTSVSSDDNEVSLAAEAPMADTLHEAAKTLHDTNAPELTDTPRNDEPQAAITTKDINSDDNPVKLIIENVKGIAFFPTAAVNVSVDNVKLGNLSEYGTSSFKIPRGKHSLTIGTRTIWVNIPKDTDSVQMTFKWNRLGDPIIICGQSEIIIQSPSYKPRVTSYQSPQSSQNYQAPQSIQVTQQGQTLRCPVCNSEDLLSVTESETVVKGGGYGIMNGCCGYILLGPLGFLCGLCGREPQTKVTNHQLWFCKTCGHKFGNDGNGFM